MTVWRLKLITVSVLGPNIFLNISSTKKHLFSFINVIEIHLHMEILLTSVVSEQIYL